MKIDKVIIWGHKTNHTHSHIHSSYYRAFKHLGYETYWLDNPLEISSIDNCLFFTEGQVDFNIPLSKNSYYILHHCNLEKYKNIGCKYLQLGNYLKFCTEGKNHYYPGASLEKLDSQVYYDSKNILLYQMWATDLTPNEIDETLVIPFDNNLKEIYYVGSIWNENINQLKPFAESCIRDGRQFINRVNVSDEEHKQLIQKSLVCPDVRGEWHKECGYVPCRIFKNLSYGKFTATNSEYVAEVFEYKIPVSSENNLYEVSKQSYASVSKTHLQSLVKFIKEKHTYVNRISNLLKILETI